MLLGIAIRSFPDPGMFLNLYGQILLFRFKDIALIIATIASE